MTDESDAPPKTTRLLLCFERPKVSKGIAIQIKFTVQVALGHLAIYHQLTPASVMAASGVGECAGAGRIYYDAVDQRGFGNRRR